MRFMQRSIKKKQEQINSILFIDKIILNEIHAEIILSTYNRKQFYYIYLTNRIQNHLNIKDTNQSNHFHQSTHQTKLLTILMYLQII